MRFGCCANLEQLDAVAEAGYDYAELPIAALVPERPESEFAPVRERLLASPVKAEVWRMHLPDDLKITGPEVDWPRLARFAYTALRRASAVGGAVIAFCSGPSRCIPEGFSRDEAANQTAEFLRICGTAARSQGLIVAVEPLERRHTNLINSLPEAVEFARQVGLPEVGVLPNITAMLDEGHSLLDIVDAAQWLAHVHLLAALITSPEHADAAADLRSALRLADYDWRISVTDAPVSDAAQAKAFVEKTKALFERTDALT